MARKKQPLLKDVMKDAVDRELLKQWLDDPLNMTAIPAVQRLVEKELAKPVSGYIQKPTQRDIEILVRLSKGEKAISIYRDLGQESKAFYRGIVRTWRGYFEVENATEDRKGVEQILEAFSTSVINPNFKKGPK
ncbi:hypothetical protein AB4383_08025 [Vibrio breoganii]